MNKIKFFTAGSMNELELLIDKFSKGKAIINCNMSVAEVYGVVKFYCCLVYGENKQA